MAGIKRIFGFRMLKYLEFLNINGMLYNLSGNGAEVSAIEEWCLHFNHYQHKQGEVCCTTSSFLKVHKGEITYTNRGQQVEWG